MGDRPGRNCSTTYSCDGVSPFVAALHALPEINQMAVHDITSPEQPVMIEGYPGLAKYVWSNRSAPLLASFLSTWVKTNGFDGMYHSLHFRVFQIVIWIYIYMPDIC